MQLRWEDNGNTWRAVGLPIGFIIKRSLDGWSLQCVDLFGMGDIPLSKDLEYAKREAVARVRAELEKVIEALD